MAAARFSFSNWRNLLHAPASGYHLDRETAFKRYLYRNFYTLASIMHRFRRRLTLTGWVVLGGTIAAAALGADTAASSSYQTFAILGCIVLASALCTPLGRPRLSLKRILPKFGSVGDVLRYRIVVQNLGKKAQSALKLIEELPDPRPTLEEFVNTPEPGEEKRNWWDRTYGFYRWRWLMRRNTRARVPELDVPTLPPNGESTVMAELTPLRRGVLRLSGMTVACPDPFGIFRALRKNPLPENILILPKRHDMPLFELPGAMKYQIGGVSLASSVGESEEFVSLREYRPGDPLRRMHWKSFAKLGKPIVKEYQEEFFVRHSLVLDTFGGSILEAAFEEAVSVAASLAYTIRDQDSLLDLMFIGSEAYCFTSGRGVGHIEQMMEILASVQMCRDKKFVTLEQLVLTHAAELSGCVCVFLQWDDARQKLVSGLLSRRVPIRVLVITNGDERPPLGVMDVQPENFHALPLDQIAAKLAAL